MKRRLAPRRWVNDIRTITVQLPKVLLFWVLHFGRSCSIGLPFVEAESLVLQSKTS
jgi:hypothetical protein